MKKGMSFIERVKLSINVFVYGKENNGVLVEKCEECGSIFIKKQEIDARDYDMDYYAVYTCLKCGASALATEKWYSKEEFNEKFID